MKKKICVLLITIALTASLAACATGTDQTSSKESSSSTSTSQQEKEDTSQVAYTEKAPYTVDVPVYEWRAYWTCNECGTRFDNEDTVLGHVIFDCGGGYSAHEEKVQTGTKQETRYRDETRCREETRYRNESYVVTPGYYKCSCGARK